MKNKYLLRIRNADLFDVDSIRVERQAKKGWLPHSMSRSLITLKKGEPEDIDCRLLFYDTADVSYNRKMTELQETGWRYVSSDGVSQTMLTAPKGGAPAIEDKVNESKVVRRHRMAQGIVAFICFAALILLVFSSIKQYGFLPINRVFIYAAILSYGVQCVCFCISHTRNLITVTGEAGPRTSCAAFYFHTALTMLTGILLVLAIVFALCYNNSSAV